MLLDPVIQLPNAGILPAMLSTRRREIWPSRQAAAEKMKASPFFQSWDPRVLDSWIEHGLREVPTELFPAEGTSDTRVTLTTSKHQELFTFTRPLYRNEPNERFVDRDPTLQNEHPGYQFYRSEPAKVFNQLPELRPSTLYVFGETSEMSPPHEREAKMERTGVGVGGSGGCAAGRVQQKVLACGHLMAMQEVQQCAKAASEFLGPELERYHMETKAFSKFWKSQSREQQITIGPRWSEEIKPKTLEQGEKPVGFVKKR